MASILNVEHLLDRMPRNLSGGEKQRVALARSILSHPRYLLLDEPLSTVDAGLKSQLLPYLRSLYARTEIPILIVSHDLQDIPSLTDQLILLEQGRVRGVGAYMDLLQHPDTLDSPHAAGLRNTLTATVAEHDVGEGVTTFFFGPGDAENGAKVLGPLDLSRSIDEVAEVSIRPEDVALSTAPVEHLSVQNQLEGRIDRVLSVKGQHLCVVDIGVPLLAQVTLNSVKRLDLSEGRRVWCFFKAGAVRYGDIRPTILRPEDSSASRAFA